jgi:hypothetical protein
VHSGFDEAKARFANATEFVFVENRARSSEIPPPGADLGDDKHPAWNVQRHSRDIVFMIEYAADHLSPAYFVFMEDDFVMCPDAMNAIVHFINKANRSERSDRPAF